MEKPEAADIYSYDGDPVMKEVLPDPEGTATMSATPDTVGDAPGSWGNLDTASQLALARQISNR